MIIYFVVFIATLIGAITGLGGGVIIKPILLSFDMYSVMLTNFYSAMAILWMSLYSIIISKKNKVEFDYKLIMYLVIGAFIGGIIGSQILVMLANVITEETLVIVSLGLLILILCLSIYLTLFPKEIKSTYESKLARIIVGIIVGTFSAFLGIGGGILNIPILIMIFKMDAKKAVSTSLFIVFISQFSNIISLVFEGVLNQANLITLLFISLAGVVGGVFGKKISSYMSSNNTKKFFVAVLIVLVLFNSYIIVNNL